LQLVGVNGVDGGDAVVGVIEGEGHRETQVVEAIKMYF
jgi:hypothetical protein